MIFNLTKPSIVCLLFLLCSCGDDKQMSSINLANSTMFYEGISGGKKLPFLPETSVSEKKAKELLSYVKATYDDNGRLLVLTKYVKGNVYFVQEIKYSGEEIELVTVKDYTGNITRQSK